MRSIRLINDKKRENFRELLELRSGWRDQFFDRHAHKNTIQNEFVRSILAAIFFPEVTPLPVGLLGFAFGEGSCFFALIRITTGFKLDP